MAIFPNLNLEPVVQTKDRTRLDATKSFVTQDEATISLVQIRPSVSADFVDVTTDMYLDWEYTTNGTQVVTCRVTASAVSAEVSANISSIVASADYLFSNDSDLKLHEPDIMKWTEPGRNSYLNLHRRAQTIILKWLDKEGYVDINNNPFTKAAIVDIEEVKQWSTYTVLRLMFEGLSNAVDDIFDKKAKMYQGMEGTWRERVVLRLDVDGDGVVNEGEEVQLSTAFVARR